MSKSSDYYAESRVRNLNDGRNPWRGRGQGDVVRGRNSLVPILFVDHQDINLNCYTEQLELLPYLRNAWCQEMLGVNAWCHG
jgi:hypothetical protein